MNIFWKAFLSGLMIVGSWFHPHTTTLSGAFGNPGGTINSSSSLSLAGAVLSANNLSDVNSTSTSLTNLGGLAVANNLSDVANSSTARTNIGAVGLTNNNTFTASNTFQQGVTVSGNVTSTSFIANNTTSVSYIGNLDSFIFAQNATPSGFTDYGAYLNALCPSTASGTTVFVPTGNFNVSTTINITSRCTYWGQGGNGTIFTWTGAQGGTIVQENWGTLPHVSSGGLRNISLVGNSATTTNPTTCLLQGGGSGGSHGINDALTIQNCGTGYMTATNTYMSVLSNSVIVDNGQNLWIPTSSNSGEALSFTNVDSLDPANSSATKCAYFGSNAIEDGLWDGGAIDDCQWYFENGNQNFTFVGVNMENAGHNTYGSYDYGRIATSSGGTNIVWIGGNFQNDATSSAAGAPTEFVNDGGGFTAYGPTLAKTAAATSVPEFVNDSIASTNVHASVCNAVNFSNSGNGVTSIFPTSNTTNVENNGCLYFESNNYIQGFDSGNTNTTFYQGGGVAMVFGQNKGLNIGNGNAPTSILNVNGSSTLSGTLAVTGSSTFSTHLGFVTSTPVVSACGTNPTSTVGSSDNGGVITLGTGGLTSCTLTFTTKWINPPVCVVSDSSSTDSTEVSSVTSSTLVTSFAASIAGGSEYYICQGNPL